MKELLTISEKERIRNHKRIMRNYKNCTTNHPEWSANKIYNYISLLTGYSVSGIRKIVNSYKDIPINKYYNG